MPRTIARLFAVILLAAPLASAETALDWDDLRDTSWHCLAWAGEDLEFFEGIGARYCTWTVLGSGVPVASRETHIVKIVDEKRLLIGETEFIVKKSDLDKAFGD